MTQKNSKYTDIDQDELVINTIDNKYEVKKAIIEFEKYLQPSLTDRNIDLDKYSEKVFNRGIVIKAENSIEIEGILGIYANDEETRVGYVCFAIVAPQYRNNKIGTKLYKKAKIS